MSAKAKVDGAQRPKPAMRYASLAVVAVGAVFVGVTVIGQQYAAEIDVLARSLSADAAPSIERLSAARGELRRLTFATRDVLRAADAGRSPKRVQIETATKSFDAAVSAYVSLPPYPGERAQQRSAIGDIDAYRRALDLVLDRIDRGDLVRARALVETTFMPASDRADRAIEKLESLDADYASRTGTAIKRTRRSATSLAYALAAFAAIAALLVMGIVLWAHRGFAAMAEARMALESERKRLAERRASELELFAARVAHDLRNPLASIALRVSLAQRHPSDPIKVQACLSKVTSAVHHATQIIDGLLDFARAGGTPDPDARVNVADALHAVVDDLSPEIERDGIALSTRVPPNAEACCSAGALLSVLGNLLRNAVKYMGEASRERRIAVYAFERDSSIRVEVEDSGPGIPPGITEQIFEPYVRGPANAQPGIGLGLATVKRIVEAHGGSVGVHAVHGRGSCFWFELPKAPTRQEVEHAPRSLSH